MVERLYQSLGVLIVQKDLLDSDARVALLSSLSVTLRSHAIPCLRALLVTAIELPMVLIRRLPGIVNVLQQLKTRVDIRTPMLEFFSFVAQIPKSYQHLGPTDIMALFATILEGTRRPEKQPRSFANRLA